ncbi:MAG TPA: nitrate reductase subunit beta, partial [Acidobacteriota bacterium]|nr:nitrate reductase subunit beta [Acidobacteriota bacterium]
MDVRSQISMVFHLDKCIGCHTCSLACKNIWTDRKGTEYMWWNNVETKPGTGFPSCWEDQNKYNGGWEVHEGKLRLKSTGRGRIVANIFHNPSMPSLDDYYEPWTYDYKSLFNAPEGPDQPTAKPISMITGELINIESGPNWDDDLGGSPVYAEHDPNLEGLNPVERAQLFEVERLVFFYLPRICNH